MASTSNFNNELDKSLNVLYDQSSNFKLSVDLIQRLAQQFKLETFVEDNKFQLGSLTKTKKLTIAASSILLDIDFENDDTITDVSISINGNEKRDIPNEHYLKKLDNRIIINQEHNPVSLINKVENSSKSIVENVIFKNLTDTSKVLGHLPRNLKYLSTIDKYTSDTQDLFFYIESIGLFLYTIWKCESEDVSEENWQVLNGFTNSIGKVEVNNLVENELGIFINFWQDFRYINHEYKLMKSTEELLMGNNYRITFEIVPSQYQNDYQQEIIDQEWKLNDNTYKFEFTKAVKPLEGDKYWSFVLNLNHPILIPTLVLEFLEQTDYKQTQIQDPLFRELFEKLNNEEEYTQDMNIESNIVDITLIHDYPYNFIPITQVKINRLIELTSLIPVLRNFIVLTNLYSTLFNEKNKSYTYKRRRRSSRLSISYDKNLSEETKEKLKESLKLPKDVTDEEILGLNAISETANYSTIQPTKDEIDLDSFMNNDNELPKVETRDNYIDFKLNEVDLSNGDIKLSFNSSILTKQFNVSFKISNGEFILDSNSDDMELDIQLKFIKALNYTEDILIAFKAVY
ncbi:unnamed protein product [Candida verbasci]|uniref:Mediator of RNA polymerase II transcription subunit 1 n=1 Tax=Candida verbasci TaxID=1227364 RepID=A0A9W4TT40_9ASCO|nr:unnamed protein product [Candida verbasci]